MTSRTPSPCESGERAGVRGPTSRHALPAALLLAVVSSGCTGTAEVKAWNAHVAELEARLAALEDLKLHFEERRPALEAAVAESAALERRLDLVTQLRALELPELKLFQAGDAQRLTLNAPLQACRDTLRALAPLRHLTGPWRLRVEAGQCAWESGAAPELVTWREREGHVTPWVEPRPSLLSRGVDRLRAKTAAFESLIARAETDLGSLAHADALSGRVSRGLSIEQSLLAKPRPCDVEVLERAATLDAQALLEVESARLVHPLEPLADERLKGLARVSEGQMTWTCAFDGGT